jgi:NADH:ubiquinone oxidoreductase subunit 2 (subunit N)
MTLFNFFQPEYYFLISIFPELSILSFVLILIFIAVSTVPNKKSLLLSSFLNFSIIFYLALIFYFLVLLQTNLFPSHLTVFLAYNTLKLSYILIVIKLILAIFALSSLVMVKRYFMLYQLNNYEYPLFISLATLSMFGAISANNWIILFLSLELQALCFLVLFAWNRRSEKAINASLKFTVINFIASTFLLISFIEIILYTQSLNMYLANPFFFAKTIFLDLYASSSLFPSIYTPDFLAWQLKKMYFLLDYQYSVDLRNLFFNLEASDNLNPKQVFGIILKIVTEPTGFFNYINFHGFAYNPFWSFVGFLLVLSFAMKLGLVPFGFWLQDLYMGVPLPTLTFFSTAPKLTYVTVLLSLYINIFSFINPQSFLLPLVILGSLSIIVANVIMFTIHNNLLILLAWSSIANMGLLFLLMGKYPLGAYSFIYILYYTGSTFLFFLVLQYFIIKDNNNLVRHPIYFTDLAVVRYHVAYRPIFLLIILLLLNFFAIPPLVGFWMKFAAIQGILLTTVTVGDWIFLTVLLLITLIGGFSYLRVLYSLVTENTNLNLQLVYWPNSQKDYLMTFFGFVIFQLLIFSVGPNCYDIFQTNFLLMQHILIIS